MFLKSALSIEISTIDCNVKSLFRLHLISLWGSIHSRTDVEETDTEEEEEEEEEEERLSIVAADEEDDPSNAALLRLGRVL